MDTYKYTNHIHDYKITQVTPYSDFITENSSVYVPNVNQGEYTNNTHCEENTSNNQGLQCDNIMIGDIHVYLTRIFRQWVIYYLR